MINRVLMPSTSPLCPRCGQPRLSRSPQRGRLERLASLLRLYPFHCEACRHRFMALMWGKWHLEWDGQVLVMPDREAVPYIDWTNAREFYALAALILLLCLLGAWGLAKIGSTLEAPPKTVEGAR